MTTGNYEHRWSLQPALPLVVPRFSPRAAVLLAATTLAACPAAGHLYVSIAVSVTMVVYMVVFRLPPRPQQQSPPNPERFTAVDRAQEMIKECDAKLGRYRAALDAGADPTVVTEWITQTQAERVRAQAQLRHHAERPDEPARLSREAIAELVESLGDIVTALAEADPVGKAEVYRQLGLQLTYHPDTQTAHAEVHLGVRRWEMVRVRGGT